MIIATDNKHSMIDISASRQEFEALSAATQELRAGDSLTWDADPDASIEVWDIRLRALTITFTGTPDCASIHDDQLRIEIGEDSGLYSFMLFPVHVHDGCHHHHDYFPGNTYVHEKSIPLIFSIRTDFTRS